MEIKIKRSLFIGLGGTGLSPLLKVKKLFIKTYGEVPPMIGFLSVDTDGGAFRSEPNSKRGESGLNQMN